MLHSSLSATPGLLLFVTNDVIQYVQLTERTFASFSTVLVDIMILLDAEADIIGVCMCAMYMYLYVIYMYVHVHLHVPQSSLESVL